MTEETGLIALALLIVTTAVLCWLALDSMARESELLRRADERNAEVQRLLDAARDAIDHDFDRHTRR